MRKLHRKDEDASSSSHAKEKLGTLLLSLSRSPVETLRHNPSFVGSSRPCARMDEGGKLKERYARPDREETGRGRYEEDELELGVQQQMEEHVDATTWYYEQLGGFDIERKRGMHDTNGRFMSSVAMERGQTTIVVPIAGMYPGVTSEEVNAVKPLPFAPRGRWNYHLLDREAAPGGFVSLPWRSPDDYANMVAIVTNGAAIGMTFADFVDHEVVVLIDRDDASVVDASQINSKRFYAIAGPDGKVSISWIEGLPAGSKILGRVVTTFTPMVRPKEDSNGFAECDPDFNF